MAVNDVLKLNLDQSIDGDQIQNDFYYRVETDDGSGENEDPLALQFEIDVIPDWQPVVTADLSFDCIGTQKVFPGAKRAFRERFITALGTAVGQALPIVATALIQKFDPAVSGTGKKGHTFISGISEDEVEKGNLTSVLAGIAAPLLTALTSNLVTPGGGIYNPVWAVITGSPAAITSVVDWTKSILLPRIAHIGTRKTPVRKFQ